MAATDGVRLGSSQHRANDNWDRVSGGDFMSIDEKLDRSVEIIHKLNALKEDLQILEENAIVDTGTDEMLISVGDAIYNHTISAGGRRLYKVMAPHLMAAIKEEIADLQAEIDEINAKFWEVA